MNKIIKINNETFVKDLQKLQYEIDSHKDIISFLISANNTSTDAYKKYYNEYEELFKKYQNMKHALEVEYIIPEMGADTIYSWNLDFDAHEVKVN